jgi:hypothetical protein
MERREWGGGRERKRGFFDNQPVPEVSFVL